MDNKPNLFLIGSMKSATTSLHNYLDIHPEIFMTKEPWKEPNYFVKEMNLSKGIEWYLSLFKERNSQRIIGESSTDYTKYPNYTDVYNRLHDFNANAKILYIMRDPIERAISQYWWEVEYSGEGRTMKNGILQNDWIMNTSYYAKQIKPYIDLFGRENIYTLTTEELLEQPHTVMKDIFLWLGVSPDIEFGEENLKVHNKSNDKVNKLIGAGIVSKLKGGYTWDALKRIINPKLRARLLRFFSREVEKDRAGKAEAVNALRPIMLAQTKELSELLGKQFPEWKTLHRDNTNQ